MAEQTPNVLPSETVPGAEPDDELDASIQADIDMSGAGNSNPMGFDGAGDGRPPVPSVEPATTTAEPRLPTKKDANLREFLGKMDDYAPIVSFCSAPSIASLL
jgi:transcription initiation factor TFIID subunit 10